MVRPTLPVLMVLAGLVLPCLPAVVAGPVGPTPPTGATGAAPMAASGDPAFTYTNPATRDLVAFVEAAAAAVAPEGEAAFPAFRQRGGPWFQGERYVFVLSPEGQRIVYPPDPQEEGNNLAREMDIAGKPFGRMLVERAGDPVGRGWVHYQWRRPGAHERRPVWKSTYVVRVQAPSGRTFLVGSGLYEAPMERAFVIQEVNAAAELLQRQGRAAFPVLRDRRERFSFRDTYVFVDTPKGVEVVNPGFPELEGKNLIDLRDASGAPMVRNYIDLALRQGSGWTTYWWPQPDASRLPLRKVAYVRKVVTPEGETLIVGSGIYEQP
jgi:signal transduction histidine kinase